jgi:nonribosomal peptide synthetase DhbF
MMTFSPQRFDGNVMLFVASESQARPPVENWKAYVGGEIKVHPIDCAHDNMMDPAPAEKIGTLLAGELNRQYVTVQPSVQRREKHDKPV